MGTQHDLFPASADVNPDVAYQRHRRTLRGSALMAENLAIRERRKSLKADIAHFYTLRGYGPLPDPRADSAAYDAAVQERARDLWQMFGVNIPGQLSFEEWHRALRQVLG